MKCSTSTVVAFLLIVGLASSLAQDEDHSQHNQMNSSEPPTSSDHDHDHDHMADHDHSAMHDHSSAEDNSSMQGKASTPAESDTSSDGAAKTSSGQDKVESPEAQGSSNSGFQFFQPSAVLAQVLTVLFTLHLLA